MSDRFVTPTGSDALGAQALAGGKGETCDAEMGVAAGGGAGGGTAGRDGDVHDRGCVSGGLDVGGRTTEAALFANEGTHTASDAVRHTPGPWSEDRDTLAHPDEEPIPGGIYHGNLFIACVMGTGPVARANTRLIAAAPDLLAALKSALVVLEWAAYAASGPAAAKTAIKVRDDARAAIAKAEGRS